MEKTTRTRRLGSVTSERRTRQVLLSKKEGTLRQGIMHMKVHAKQHEPLVHPLPEASSTSGGGSLLSFNDDRMYPVTTPIRAVCSLLICILNVGYRVDSMVSTKRHFRHRGCHKLHSRPAIHFTPAGPRVWIGKIAEGVASAGIEMSLNSSRRCARRRFTREGGKRNVLGARSYRHGVWHLTIHDSPIFCSYDVAVYRLEIICIISFVAYGDRKIFRLDSVLLHFQPMRHALGTSWESVTRLTCLPNPQKMACGSAFSCGLREIVKASSSLDTLRASAFDLTRSCR
ncbi:hypothetical protein KC365_g39 [Hortaea werneckii]|nr:hypothetical protein KC365_g39 [Hortaea werneckii]